MSELTFLARGTTSEVVALATRLRWQCRARSVDGGQWEPENTDARVVWEEIEPGFGRLQLVGEHAEVVAADLEEVFDLVDSVDVMESIGASKSPAEVVLWAERVGALATGDFDPALASVIEGLLASDRREFVSAVLAGLRHARWPALIEPTVAAVSRWPGLGEAGRAALRSMGLAAP